MSSIEEKMAAVAPSDQKISKREYFAYGLGALGTNFVYMITATFTLKYYQVYLGADANAISAIIMAAMILDALNDPLTGIIVAKVHNSKLGKYKPWIFFGTLVNAAC
jgi:Na+/melibiose symporter-like transporter